MDNNYDDYDSSDDVDGFEMTLIVCDIYMICMCVVWKFQFLWECLEIKVLLYCENFFKLKLEVLIVKLKQWGKVKQNIIYINGMHWFLFSVQIFPNWCLF